MSVTKNIKLKDENTDKTIKLLLNIKDSHIYFPKNAVAKERVHGKYSNVFTATLSYEPPRCELCGFNTVIRHGWEDSLIRFLPYQEVPTYLHLYKQRFRCKNCLHTFSVKTYYVAENCYISQVLKFAIAVDLQKKISMKDITERYWVSSKTVERVLDTFFQRTTQKP